MMHNNMAIVTYSFEVQLRAGFHEEVLRYLLVTDSIDSNFKYLFMRHPSMVDNRLYYSVVTDVFCES